MQLAVKFVIWVVALFYLYGAAVHVMNMLSQTGFNWPEAPFKWQALDVIYLILDIIVVVGLFLSWKVGFVAFYAAAISQIILYTIFRSWILDVPKEFAVSLEQQSYLNTLVAFHIITIILITLALYFKNGES